MFFGDAKSLRRKLCKLQNKLQVVEDFVFFAGGQGFGLDGLPGKLAVDLAVYLVADGQQRVTVASFRYRQMIGKIVAQAADAPVEHRDVLIIVQEHGAFQTLDVLQLTLLQDEPQEQQDDDRQQKKQDQTQVEHDRKKGFLCDVVGCDVLLMSQEYGFPDHVSKECDGEKQQTDDVRHFGKQGFQLPVEQQRHAYDGQDHHRPDDEVDHVYFKGSVIAARYVVAVFRQVFIEHHVPKKG